MDGNKQAPAESRKIRKLALALLLGLMGPGIGMPPGHAGAAQVSNSHEALRSMARACIASGNYEKAQPLAERALDLADEANVSDSGMSACLLDLAYIYKNRGMLAQAEATCRMGMELQEKVYSEHHPYVAYALRIQSGIYREQARYKDAMGALERAIGIMSRDKGEDDPAIAPLKVDIARLLTAQGNFTEAESHFSEALAPVELRYGPDHLYTAEVRTSIAELYVLLGQYDRAEEIIRDVLVIQKKAYGSEHHFLVPAWMVASAIHQARGEYDKAETLLQNALGTVERTMGPGHPLAGEVLSRLGDLYIAGGQYARAEDALNRARKVLQKSLGADNDRTAVVLNSLAKICIYKGKYPQAEKLCQEALACLTILFDENHPKVLDVRATMARLEAAAGSAVAKLKGRAE
jgi:tetratricopeptide (TPR) repeat protein